MSRGLSASMLSAIQLGNLYPILFGYFDFFGGPVRVCTHNQAVTWAGDTYSGLGELCTIAPVMERKETEATGIAFGLNGVPSSIITELMTYRSRNRVCKLWLGLYDSTGALLADPIIIFSGRMDQPQVQDSGDLCNITVTAESRMVDLQRAKMGRYTDQDQQARFAGDLGLSYVVSLQNKEIMWGQGNSTTNPSANAPGPTTKPQAPRVAL